MDTVYGNILDNYSTTDHTLLVACCIAIPVYGITELTISHQDYY